MPPRKGEVLGMHMGTGGSKRDRAAGLPPSSGCASAIVHAAFLPAAAGYAGSGWCMLTARSGKSLRQHAMGSGSVQDRAARLSS